MGERFGLSWNASAPANGSKFLLTIHTGNSSLTLLLHAGFREALTATPEAGTSNSGLAGGWGGCSTPIGVEAGLQPRRLAGIATRTPRLLTPFLMDPF
ncbi:unnamed protein product, partial [Iphiclides podalirius]